MNGCSLLSLSVPSLILPYQKKREKERESPPSILFQFTFQFQGALLARLCLSDAKAANKNTVAFEAKRKQLWHHIIANTTIRTIIISIQIISICLPFFFSVHTISRGRSRIFLPFLIVMGYGKCFTKLCKHMREQRGGSSGKLITANEFLRK